MIWRMPWPEPASDVYDSRGPKEEMTFELDGARFRVIPSKGVGLHTGRRRYRTICDSCGEVLHLSTTGPESYIEGHLREKKHKLPD